MKILHVLVTFDKGGAENHVVDLAIQQMEHGHTVTIAFLKGKGYLRSRVENRGIAVIDLGMRCYGDPGAFFRLRALVNSFRPSIAHAHLPGAEVYLAIVKVLGGACGNAPTCFIASRHNDAPFGPTFLHAALERWVTKRFAHYICISRAVRNLFVEKRKTMKATQGSVVYYGLDCRPFKNVSDNNRRSVRNAWGVDDNAVVYLCIARLVPQKGIDLLLKAFSTVLNKSDSSSRSLLVIAGRGPLEGELHDLTNSLGISDHVRWLGFQDDVPGMLAAADGLVLSSLYEGLGLVLLEAAAAGKPVIASNVSAIPEIVENEETGLLVPPGSIDGIAAALLRLRDPVLRQRLGTAAQLKVSKTFTPHQCFEATMEIYERFSSSTATAEVNCTRSLS